jgi:hypothetical protein
MSNFSVFQPDLKYKHVAIQFIYNTYKKLGLPPNGSPLDMEAENYNNNYN